MTAVLSRTGPPAGRAPAVQLRPTGKPRRSPSMRGVWWVSPMGSLLMVVPLSLAVAVQIPDSDYRFFYKVPRVIGADQAELFLLSAGALILGTLVPQALRAGRNRRPWTTLVPAQLHLLRRAETVAFRLTMLGYLLLGALGVARGARPSLLIQSIVSQSNYSGRLKTLFAPVAGVTSLTQIGIAYVVIAGILMCYQGSRVMTRRLLIVLALGLLRSYLLTERLALLELLAPLIAIGATQLRQRRRGGGWLTFAPIVAVPLLLVIFGAFEYSRSWVFYRNRTALSYPQFTVNRLAGYYATSYNNGALQLLHRHAAGSRLAYSSIEAFWTAPGIAQSKLYFRLTGHNGADLLNTVLAQYGNPEFNNPGGLAVPAIDFGPAGGVLFFLIAGLLVGFAYRSWRSGQPLGLLVYPVLFTGLLEIPRYLYWTQGRVFPPLVFLMILAVMLNRVRRGTRGPVAASA